MKGCAIIVLLYITPAELASSPFGIGVSASLSQLGANVVDQLIARASEQCDMATNKRLQAPGTSTLASIVHAGDKTVSVASTLTIDNREEQAIWINPNAGNQEVVSISSGGVTTTSWANPYPGTINIDIPCVNGHASGEPIQYLYKEVTEAGSSSSSDPYTEALQTQAMQLALAHLPPARTALTRIVFLKSYPIISLYSIEHAFSFVNQFNPIDMNIETIVPSEGWYRFNVATVVLREGIMRTTYTGGFQTIPDDIKNACILYVANQMKLMINPYGMQGLTMGKRSYHWDTSKGKSTLTLEAEDILKKYKRLI